MIHSIRDRLNGATIIFSGSVQPGVTTRLPGPFGRFGVAITSRNWSGTETNGRISSSFFYIDLTSAPTQ